MPSPTATTAYARNGDVHIAYQVVGAGPIDLLAVPGLASNLEAVWELPALARYLRGLASFARLIMFDKRGTGLSDRVRDDRVPTLEEQMDDVLLVMDTVGSARAALLAHGEAGPASALFAAAHPERAAALILYGSHARGVGAKGYPFAPSAADSRRRIDRIERAGDGEAALRALAPSLADDPTFREWWEGFVRRSAGPRFAAALARMSADVDVRPVLGAISAPSLVLHRAGDLTADPRGGRWMARQIPGARFVRLPGRDHLPFVGEVEADALLAEIRRFLATLARPDASGSVLATVLVTDVASSATQAVEMGDRRWMDAVEAHRTVVRWHLARHAGREATAVGPPLGSRNPVVATFDGPVRAIRCALAIRAAVRARGMEMRAGIHTGPIELRDGAAGGPGVDGGARVASMARPGEVLVTPAVTGLVAGSGLRLEDAGDPEQVLPDGHRPVRVLA